MISLKVHKKGVVSLCDSNLIGKEFTDGAICLNVSKRFYQGEDASREDVAKAFTGAQTMNIVGEESIMILVELGIIDKKNVRYIQGIPHVQIF